MATMSEYTWIEFENDDLGPFESEELAEMVAKLELGENWRDEAQLFHSGANGRPIIRRLVHRGLRPSRLVAYEYAS